MELLAWLLGILATGFLATTIGFPQVREWRGVSVRGLGVLLLVASAFTFVIALLRT